MASLKKQALVLTIANAYTRALGFVLRLITARLMGTEALGVMELSSSAIMLAITPATAGIPTAISRLTAQPGADKKLVLKSGLSLIYRISALLIPLLLLLAPLAAWLLGDWRTLPSILTSAPVILLLGLCAVYSGWYYGCSEARIPAINECIEQTIRCLVCGLLLLMLSNRSIALTAALPGLAEIAAGLVVWMLFFHRSPQLAGRSADPAMRSRIFRLAAPTTASRLCQTAMRALNAVLLPVCLHRSGLSSSAATAQFGLLNGMAMPLIMLPGIVTGAISMVSAPAVSQREQQPAALRCLMRRLMFGSACTGGSAAALLWFGARFISTHLYAEPALAPLLRLLSPAAVLMALQQVQFGAIAGLGLQRKALTAAIATSVVSLLVTALFCPLPQVGLYGAAIAILVSALLRTIWNQAILTSSLLNKS